VRSFWLYAFKYCRGAVITFRSASCERPRRQEAGRRRVADAVGTIGLFDNIKGVVGVLDLCEGDARRVLLPCLAPGGLPAPRLRATPALTGC
jgi:hypothetical protein